MAEDYIFTENMTVGYGKMPLIAQIEIHVKRGQIVTLIGPNGAGKSTILKSIIRQIDLLGGRCVSGPCLHEGYDGKTDSQADVSADDGTDTPGTHDL